MVISYLRLMAFAAAVAAAASMVGHELRCWRRWRGTDNDDDDDDDVDAANEVERASSFLALWERCKVRCSPLPNDTVSRSAVSIF